MKTGNRKFRAIFARLRGDHRRAEAIGIGSAQTLSSTWSEDIYNTTEISPVIFELQNSFS
jgi:hypothetical protein